MIDTTTRLLTIRFNGIVSFSHVQVRKSHHRGHRGAQSFGFGLLRVVFMVFSQGCAAGNSLLIQGRVGSLAKIRNCRTHSEKLRVLCGEILFSGPCSHCVRPSRIYFTCVSSMTRLRPPKWTERPSSAAGTVLIVFGKYGSTARSTSDGPSGWGGLTCDGGSLAADRSET